MFKGFKKIKVREEKRAVVNPYPYPPNEILGCVIGRSGSGKTYLLLEIVPNICPDVLKHIIICSRIIGNPVYDQIENFCNETGKTYKFCSDLDEAKEAIETTINEKDDNEHLLIILDDFNDATITTKSNKFTKMTIDIFSKMRNYNAHMLFIVQNYTSVPVICRSNINMIISFQVGDKYSRDILNRDLCPLIGVEYMNNKEELKEVHNLLVTKHSYITATPFGLFVYIHGHTKNSEKINILK